MTAVEIHNNSKSDELNECEDCECERERECESGESCERTEALKTEKTE